MTPLRLGALSGLLLALSFPPLPLPLLAFVALAPLAMALEGLPPGSPGGRPALRAGLACGAVSWALLLHWIPAALWPVAPAWALPLFLLVVGGLAILTGAVARLALALRLRGVPVAVGMPILWVLGEWLRTVVPGLELAWLPLGNALVPVPALAAPAEWVGVLGLSAWAALTGTVAGVGLARLGRGGTAGHRSTPGRIALPVVLLFPAAAGALRDATLVPVPILGVAALQIRAPGGPGRPPSSAEMAEALAPHLAAPPGGRDGVDLLLLPEGTVPSNRPVATGEPSRPVPPDPGPEDLETLLRTLAAASARSGVPLVAGGYATGAGSPGPWNAALSIAPDGDLRVVHRKRHLVPGLEGGDGILRRWLAPGGAEGAAAPPVGGGEPGSMEVGGRSLGFLICYESAFSGAVRRPPAREVEAYAALTHEGWFGEAGLHGSIPRAQHIAHLRMRAVESRSGIVRSAADGEALILDPRGRVVTRGGGGGDGWIVGRLEGVEGQSLHARTPPALVPAVLALVLAALSLPGRRGAGTGRRGRGS